MSRENLTEKRLVLGTVGVPVLYGGYDYDSYGKKYRVWSHDDFVVFLRELNMSCTEVQKQGGVVDKLYSLSPINRSDVLAWCKFVNSSDGALWKQEFGRSVKEFGDFFRAGRGVLKNDLSIVYNVIPDVGSEEEERERERDGWCCEALESDSRLDAVLSLIDIVKFAVMADEWILLIVALEHMNKSEFKDFLVHMFQMRNKAHSVVFFNFFSTTTKQKESIGIEDYRSAVFEKFWRVFHGLLPVVIDKLSNRRETLEEIYNSFLTSPNIGVDCLIWPISVEKARQRWGSEEPLLKKLHQRQQTELPDADPRSHISSRSSGSL